MPRTGVWPLSRSALIQFAVVTAIALIIFIPRWAEHPQATGDTFWSLRSAQLMTGHTATEARTQALTVYCPQILPRSGPALPDCLHATSWDRVSPRYVAIFDQRPGFPALIALFSLPLGLAGGQLTAVVLLFVLGLLVMNATLRAGGLHPIAAVTGSVLLGALPIGFWDSRALAEGGAVVGMVGLLIGCTWAHQGRLRLGIPTLLLAGGWLAVCKPASFVASAPSLATVCLLTAAVSGLRGRRRHQRSITGCAPPWRGPLVAGLTIGCVVAAWAVGALLTHAPGLAETAQDLGTAHFSKPDLADPYGYLISYSRVIWTGWLPTQSGFMTMLRLSAVAAVVCAVRWPGHVGWLWLCLGLSGPIVFTIHPLPTELSRLTAPTWLVVVAAGAVLVDLVVTRTPWIARKVGAARGVPALSVPDPL
jgi:hypothetical protein